MSNKTKSNNSDLVGREIQRAYEADLAAAQMTVKDMAAIFDAIVKKLKADPGLKQIGMIAEK